MNYPINPTYKIFYAESILFSTASAARSIEIVSNTIENITLASTNELLENIDSHALLDELQNIILHGASISRYFWPSKKQYKARGKQLRDLYSISDSSPLKSRRLRNLIEHFDENLDDYLSNGIVGYIIPQYFGYEGKSGGVPIHFFRAYFLNCGEFEILGQKYKIEPIAQELLRIHELSLEIN